MLHILIKFLGVANNRYLRKSNLTIDWEKIFRKIFDP